MFSGVYFKEQAGGGGSAGIVGGAAVPRVEYLESQTENAPRS